MIKFRGKSINTGTIVYGDLINVRTSLNPTIVTDSGASYTVDDSSVAQLIGLDENGNEVYEGDMVQDNLGNTYTAEISKLILPQNTLSHTEALQFLPAYRHLTLVKPKPTTDLVELMKNRYYALVFMTDDKEYMFQSNNIKYYCKVYPDNSFQFFCKVPAYFNVFKSEIGNNILDDEEFKEIHYTFTNGVEFETGGNNDEL